MKIVGAEKKNGRPDDSFSGVGNQCFYGDTQVRHKRGHNPRGILLSKI